ncbi:MAG: trehalase family glycosidase [Candidatus Bathyarchaeia archaeon]
MPQLLTSPVSVSGTITRVQWANSTISTGTIISFSMGRIPVAGDGIVLIVGNRQGMVVSVVETNVFWSHVVQVYRAGVGCVEIWFGAVSSSASASIVVTLNASATYGASVDACEYSNIALFLPVDKTATSNTGLTNTTALTGTTSTTSLPNELCVGGIEAIDTRQTGPATNRYTMLDGANVNGTTSGQSESLTYLENITTSESITGSSTTISSMYWEGAIATFMPNSATALVTVAEKALLNNLKVYNGFDIIVPQTSSFDMPYCWDTYFSTLGALTFNTNLTKSNINGEFSTQETSGVYNGMIPNAPSSASDQNLRSQPPLLADAVLQYYQATGDLASLASWYPKLQAYFQWYNTYSDIKGNNLYAPLTGRTTPGDGYTAFYAVASSGMDNAPVYDLAGTNVTQIGSFYYLPMNDLLLSSSMALFAKDMGFIATALGYTSNAISYDNSYIAISNAINTHLWNATEGRYNSQLWTGQQIQVNSIQTFMPMIAGVASSAQAADLVANLENLAEYNLTYGIPTVAANDPNYLSTEPSYFFSSAPYWRGGIWAPTTYLVCKGLANYGYTSLVNAITTKWVNLVSNEPAYPFAEYHLANGSHGSSDLSNQSWTSATTMLLLNGESASPPAPIPITFISSPTGTGYITLNGTAITTPYTATCGVGDSETIVANSLANMVSGQSRYVWQSWNDSRAQSHSITVSSSTLTYVATFQLQYYLTVTGGDSPVGTNWLIPGRQP